MSVATVCSAYALEITVSTKTIKAQIIKFHINPLKVKSICINHIKKLFFVLSPIELQIPISYYFRHIFFLNQINCMLRF